jgi:hypothetical protein
VNYFIAGFLATAGVAVFCLVSLVVTIFLAWSIAARKADDDE